MTPQPGTLYVVATPIGNRQDASERMITTLKSVNLIAAEDTRHSLPLLQHYAITTPLISLHEHNESSQSDELINRLLNGDSIALISDAGTPGISDPGQILVDKAHLQGVPVSPIPGANAAISLMSVSGFKEGRFLFIGFLPTKKQERHSLFTQLKQSTIPTILYEAPHRIEDTLNELSIELGEERSVVLGRELTKLFEEVQRTTLKEAINWVKENPHRLKGEYVLVIDGQSLDNKSLALERHDQLIQALLEKLSLSDAVKLAQTITGEKRNFLYERALTLTNP